MSDTTSREFLTPRDGALGLKTITNPSGLSISALPNGALFAISHRDGGGSQVMINQVLGSPIEGGIGRIWLRIGGKDAHIVQLVGPRARVEFATDEAQFCWQGETRGIAHTVTLQLDPAATRWFWQIEITNNGDTAIPCDVLLAQDLGLGGRGFLMGSEAYASQYIDHRAAQHSTFGPVVLSRQNLSQGGRFPWHALGCINGAAGFATDAIQLFGPDFRARDEIELAFGTDLPSIVWQHELACPTLQSKAKTLAPGATTSWTFFSQFVADHPEASSDSDLARLDDIAEAAGNFPANTLKTAPVARSLLQDALPLAVLPLDDEQLKRLYPTRELEEHDKDALLSFFVPDGTLNRHVVLAEKEALVARRHGAIVRSGQSMMPDEATLAATCWMHGVFAAQLTIGNTSFHKLFSVSRDPYNITRASGLRILIDAGEGWRLLSVPSVFEIGLSDCRWIYRLADRTVTVSAIASGAEATMQWRVTVEGPAARFLVLGHIVLGEREYEQSGRITIDAQAKRFTFQPGTDWLWGQNFPDAAYHLVTSTPEAVEAIGGDELLYEDGVARGGGYIALRTGETSQLAFAVVGSMNDAAEAQKLADRYAAGMAEAPLLEPAARYWRHVTGDLRVGGEDEALTAEQAILPWLAHDAMIHLTVPHGLEQYTGAAWGTRDVCQGPLEFMLALRHDETARAILTTLFAEQYRTRGDWPQWFMLPPYSNIRAGEAHGDIVVWPLKALCDYLEATGDFAFLDVPLPWRRDDNLKPTEETGTIREHVELLLATVRERFIPGTHLIRYGEGDWNDSLQPADPHLRDWMVSSWTVALLYEQIQRYAAILARVGDIAEATALSSLAEAMRGDVNRSLIRDGVIAGYGLFDPGHYQVELLLHPSDRRTGLSYSLIPMTQAVLGGLFTQEQTQTHLALIREHLLDPDGARLMDKPVAYRGGVETLFRRAESAAFFGREIGLMYVHAHLRYCEALAVSGDAAGAREALSLVNPIAVTDVLAQASLRQRNTYFSSSDAAFHDRYHASAEWDRVRNGDIAVDGGWRIYSSGPGLYTQIFVRRILGMRRDFGIEVERNDTSTA
ncbi:GH36-type glycosyl hydrolase domain-containing protein [Kaistia terrae]|uniref:GH36-type glycosyl hydrolase domain-containing protein n=1 Tax=Kaistia terrae TaxID=537017 RepID=A0ABW0Q3M7_9HYPH|nr:cellobiose phosphorylase [Kaistia terrae]MCX5578776.1 cellobiose phosphorylase [Kaistia terrae]